LERLGEGTYGIVYKCVDRISNKVIAVKKIRIENIDEGIPSTAL